MQVYLVGGAVRDALLGLDNQDQDYVLVGANVQQMLDLGYLPVGADFPVFLHPQSKAEFALARTERKQGMGYLGFEVDSRPSVTLAEDLLRRDLTINAMAIQLNGLDDLTPIDGTIIDPYGGQQDLQARRLKHVSDAFAEDPLRVLRVARFYGRYKGMDFNVDDSTLMLICTMVASGELNSLTRERVWQETSRAMMQDYPHAYWQLLQHTNAMQVIFSGTFPTLVDLSDDGLLAVALRLCADRCLNLSQRWAVFTAMMAKSHDETTYDKTHDKTYDNSRLNTQQNQSFNHNTDVDVDAWQMMIQKLDNSITIPKKISKFAQLTAKNALMMDKLLMHTLLSQSVAMTDSSNVNTNAKLSNQAQIMTEFINTTKANKDAKTWQQIYDVLALMKQAQMMVQMQHAINAFCAVGMNDIEPNLSGQAIGKALNEKRQQRIKQTLS